ncbi:MAG: DUF4214 domain-containing protein, partial [Betaproteobacteria bacterium]|nr:DUF4214 domain-containing protein [Betaproteobacteria bacterium]
MPTLDALKVQQLYQAVLSRAPNALELVVASQHSAAGALDEASLTLMLIGSAEYRAVVQPVVAVYDAFVGRLPDEAGFRFWTNSLRAGESLGKLVEGFLGSGEFAGLAQSSNNSLYVAALYDRVLGRSADSQGQAYWTGLLERGAISRKDLALSFLQSTESATTLQASGAFAQSYVALRAAQPGLELTLSQVDANRGSSIGAIFNTRIVPEALYQAILQRAPTPTELSADNASLALGLLNEPQLATRLLASSEYLTQVQPVIAMYDAFMGRLPDSFGLAYWSGVLRAGSPQESVVSGFLNSGEYSGLSQSASNKLFVDTLYARVLGREPDPSGSAYWVDLLSKGQASREAVAVSFLKSGESASSVTASNALANAYVLLRAAGLGSDLSMALVEQGRGVKVDSLIAAKVAVVADGYLSGATVWVDADNDGVKDAGERSVITDAKGKYLSFAEAYPVVATGGTDTGTGLAFYGQLSAPAGATVVNPITTLVEKLSDRGLSVISAQDYVAKALGLNGAGAQTGQSSLLTTDWLAVLSSQQSGSASANVATMSAAFAAQSNAVQLANLMRISASLVPTDKADELADGIATAMAGAILANLNRPLDLQSVSLLNAVINAGLSQAAAGISSADAAALSQSIAALNAAVASQSAATMAALASGATSGSQAVESLAKFQVIGQSLIGVELAKAKDAKKPLDAVAAKFDASALQALATQVQAGTVASGGLVLPIDKLPPAVAASSLALQSTNQAGGGLAILTIQFSEPVYGLDLSDFEITNAKAGELVRDSALSYRLQLLPDSQVEGAITVRLKAGAVRDVADNVSLAPSQALGNLAIDTKAPSLSLTASASTATVPGAPPSIATALPITFTLSFSEPIETLKASDLGVTNGSLGSLLRIDSKTYQVVATPNKDFSGDLVFSLAGSAAKDLKGNTLTTAANKTVAVDTKAPTLAITDHIADSQGNPQATGLPVVFSLTFSEPVFGLTLEDFSLSGGSLSKLTAKSSTQWEVTATPQADFLGDMSLTLKAGSVTDALGNPLAAAVGALQRVDSKAPTAALSDTANGLATGQVALRIAFDEPVTGLTASDLSLSGARLDSFTQLTATIWQALITPLASAGTPAGVLSPGTSADAQLKGTITASLPIGAASDAAGNPSKATSLSVPFQIVNPNPTPLEGDGNQNGGGTTPPRDREPPTLQITDDVSTVIAAGSNAFTFSFSEAVKGFDINDITVSGGSKGTFTQLTDRSFRLLVSPTNAAGDEMQVSVAAGAASDLADNALSRGVSASQRYAEAPVLVSVVTDSGVANIGASLSDKITNDTTPFISATAAPGSLLGLYSGLTFVAPAVEVAPGSFQINVSSAIAEGTYSLVSYSGDPNSPISKHVAQGVVVIDTTAPTAPSLSSLTTAAGTPGTATDASGLRLTDDSTPAVTVTGAAGGSVALFDANDLAVTSGVTVTENAGTYTLSVTSALSEGVYQLKALDVAGNASSALRFKVDTSAPTVTSLGLPSGSFSSGAALDFTLQFSESISVAGTPRLTLGIGGQQRFADFNAVASEAAGSNKAVFRYVVQSGDSNLDNTGAGLGLSLGASIDLNGGSIKDRAANPVAAANAITLTASNLSALSALVIDGSTAGRAADGYLDGVTLFADNSGDRALGPTDSSALTDPTGGFKLYGASGPLIMYGGTDISTGLAFQVQYEAPAGYKVVNPITSVIRALQRNGSALSDTEAEAASLLRTALFGVSGGPSDFSNYDPFAASTAAGATPTTISDAIKYQRAAAMIAAITDVTSDALRALGVVSNQRDGSVKVFEAIAAQL